MTRIAEQMASDQQGGHNMLPKLHPVYKTYLDLKRCASRLDDYIAHFPEDKQNDADLYMEIHSKIEELIMKIPKEYR